MPSWGILVSGLVAGSLAGINSLGIVLLWRTTRVINLAQPAMGLVGGVLTGLLVVHAGWSFWWAAPLGLLMGAALGLVSERAVIRRLQEVPRAVLLVATVGLAAIFSAIQTALPFIFVGRPVATYDINLGIRLQIGEYQLSGPGLLALIALPLSLLAMYLFLHRSRIGLAACALGQDGERARALGVPAGVVRAAVWAVAGMLASVSGILSIPTQGFNLGGGLAATLLLFALAPAVFAGLRSLAVAAGAALALGVGYQLILGQVARAGMADLMLVGAVLLAIAMQRRLLGRAEAAARASSWEAAATPRPLPWHLLRATGVRVGTVLLVAGAAVAAILPPFFLGPGDEVLYATSAALAIGALAVAVAWIFAGEVALGHWGLAGFGAVVAALTPGPWIVRCAAAALVIGLASGALGLISRRQSALSFAVIGLAIAAAAQTVLNTFARDVVPANPGTVGAAAGALAVLAVVAVTLLRSSVPGVRMVAARDDPARAPWLGADVLRGRVLGLALSGVLAGLAGALYIAATPAGIAPGAFEATRSLDLLTMAVIGGLGSPAGAVLGAATIQSARQLLPDQWAMVVSGTGVLLVVLFLPGGLSRGLGWLRDRAARLLAGSAAAPPARATDAVRPIVPASEGAVR